MTFWVCTDGKYLFTYLRRESSFKLLKLYHSNHSLFSDHSVFSPEENAEVKDAVTMNFSL